MALPKTKAVAVKPTAEQLNAQLKTAIRAIDKELRTLGTNPNEVLEYKTNGSFKYNELDSNTVNILTNMNGEYLVKCLSKMIRVEKDYAETMQEMGITTYPICLWYGQPVSSWIHDLKMRVKLVLNHGRITELNKAKEELYTFLSNEDRLSNTLEKLAVIIKK